MNAPLDKIVTKESHHKMSKKIAQLIKVIYVLHTTIDDHDAEVKKLKDIHEKDKENMVFEHNRKLKSFKDFGSKVQQSQKIIEKLKTQQSREKQQYLAELEEFKSDMKEKFSKQKERYSNLVKGVNIKLEEAQEEFASRLQGIDDVRRKLEDDLRSKERSLKNQHASEIAETVRNANDKYNKMVTELMNEQETMKANYEAQLEAAKEREKRLVEEHIQKRNEELDAQRKKFQGLQANSQSELGDKIMKLNTELERLRKSELFLNAQLQQQLRQLNDKDDKLDQLTEKLSVEQKEHKSDIEQRDQLIKKLKDDLDKQSSSAGQTAKELEDKLRDITSQNEALKTSLENVTNQTQELMEEVNVLNAKLENQANNLGSDLTSLKMESAKRESQYKETIESLKQTLGKREDAIAELQKSIEMLKDQLTMISSNASSDTERLKEAMEAKEIEYQLLLEKQKKEQEEKLNALEEDHKNTLKIASKEFDDHMLKANMAHKHEVEKLQSELANLQEKLKNAVSEKQAECDELHAKLTQLEEELSYMKETSNKGRSELIKQIETLKQEKANIIKEMRDQAIQQRKEFEEKLRVIQSKLDTAEKQNRALREQYDALKAQYEKEVSELKGNIDTLKEKIASIQQKHAAAMADLKLQHSKDISSLRDSLNTKWKNELQSQLDQLSDTLTGSHEGEKKQLIDSYEKRIASLSGDAASNIQQLNDDLDAKQASIDALSSKLEETITSSKNTLEETKQNFENAKQRLVKDYEQQLQQLQDSLLKDQSSQADAMREATALQIANLEKEHQSKMDQMEKDKEAALLHLQQQNDNVKEAALAAAHKKRDDEQRHALSQLQQQLSGEQQSMRQKMNTIIADLKDQIAAHEQSLTSCQATIRSNNSEIDQLKHLREQLHHSVSKLEGEIDKLKRDHRDAMDHQERSMTQQKDAELRKMMDDHLTETQQLERMFTKNEMEWQHQNDQLREQIRAWEHKYEHREPRPQDVERIRLLERELVNKENLLRKSIEDMKYIKREFYNREDTYNKTFGANPNVGVINPLAGKTQKNGTTRNTSKVFQTVSRPKEKLPPISMTTQQQPPSTISDPGHATRRSQGMRTYSHR